MYSQTGGLWNHLLKKAWFYLCFFVLGEVKTAACLQLGASVTFVKMLEIVQAGSSMRIAPLAFLSVTPSSW